MTISDIICDEWAAGQPTTPTADRRKQDRGLARRALAYIAKGVAGFALLAGSVFATTGTASASAGTCISAGPTSQVCTYVDGSGTWVNHVQSQYFNTGAICNYSAWFYYVPPSGGAYGYGYQSRAGCVYGVAYFQQNVYRSFPAGTLMCAKFMTNYGAEVGEKCVGLS